jgi:hypothetical protein
MESETETETILPAVLGLSRLGWTPAVASLTFEQWAATIDAAAAVERASPFWIGDLWNYAQSRGKEFEDRAIQGMPCRIQTARNYGVVCRLFPPTHRRGALTMKHLAVMVKLARKEPEKAQEWLATAEAEEWSATELEEAVYGQALPAQDATQGPEPSPTVESPAPDAVAGPDWRDAMLLEASGLLMDVPCTCMAEGCPPHYDDCLIEAAGEWRERLALRVNPQDIDVSAPK